MKKVKVILIAALAVVISACGETSTEVAGSDSSEEFMVYGNCGMCEKTIEGSLSGVEGISSADWNKENDMIKVTFNPSLVSLSDIKNKIASVGYDMDDVKASDETYAELPGCCQYDRP